ncbi:MAG: DUF6082 family protein [Pseudonocardiales bacterium]|jgi:hypothetical protein|nr:DUF6082 family protein [Pseudonocardiales bacterium]
MNASDGNTSQVSRWRRVLGRAAPAVGITAASVLVILVLSPLFLQVAALIYPVDWIQLSAIGQSFTGVAALLSAAALGAAILTIRLQTRQNLAAQEQALRQTQYEITKLAIENDDLMEVAAGLFPADADRKALRQHTYLTMSLRHFQFVSMVKSMPRDDIEFMIESEYFANPAGVAHWSRVRPLWSTGKRTSSERRFLNAVEAVYERVRIIDDDVV